MSATAVILQNRFSNDGATILSVAVDGRMVHESWNHTVSTNDARAQMIDAFLDLWNVYCEQGLVLYVSSRTVRNLLKEQQELFDGLLIRDTITGSMFRKTWDVCSASHHKQRREKRPLPSEIEKEPTPLVVVATDASKGKNSKTVGLSAVNSCGIIKTHEMELNSIFDGELSAINFALQQFGKNVKRLEVLTDSRQAIQYIQWSGLLRKRRCRRLFLLVSRGITGLWSHCITGCVMSCLSRNASWMVVSASVVYL
ncbi:hypothetical protein CZ765_13275 [Corynebacterium casei]|nr:hypothetical protein CZ765_13275 [Corynebacterium casei]